MTVLLNTVELPDQFMWVDEFRPRVASRVTRTSGGIARVEVSAEQSGRPITLTNDSGGPTVDRATLLALQALSAQPGLVMTLQRHGETYQVVFTGKRLEVNPFMPHSESPTASDRYRVALYLLEI